MTAWPDPGFALLKRYVRGRRYRGPTAGSQTASVIRCFQRFVMSRTSAAFTPAVLVEWLRSLTNVAKMSMVIRRAQIVDPFLDWLVELGHLTTNPFAELKAASRPHGIRPIVLALLSDDPEAALARLQPLPRYGSHLGPVLQAHVTRMQTLGYKCNERPFLRFDRFLQVRSGAAEEPVSQLVQAHIQEASSPSVQYERIRVGRALARALQRIDPSAPEPPPYDPILMAAVLRQRRRPHVFSHDEIARLFRTAREFPSPQMPLRPHSMYAMLVLAYCTGLRIGEIVRLQLGDLRLQEGWFEVRESKFFKSRRVPLRTSVVNALKDYLDERARAGLSQGPDAPFFCHDRGGYVYMTASRLLREVIRAAGLKPAPGRRGPRVHDLRHTFVVHRMLEWYRQGINPESKLPYLSTYLGHRGIHSTLVYLTITQELLGLANERFRAFGARVLVPTQGESHAFDAALAAEPAAAILPRLVDPPARRLVPHGARLSRRVATIPAVRGHATQAGRRRARLR